MAQQVEELEKEDVLEKIVKEISIQAKSGIETSTSDDDVLGILKMYEEHSEEEKDTKGPKKSIDSPPLMDVPDNPKKEQEQDEPVEKLMEIPDKPEKGEANTQSVSEVNIEHNEQKDDIGKEEPIESTRKENAKDEEGGDTEIEEEDNEGESEMQDNPLIPKQGPQLQPPLQQQEQQIEQMGMGKPQEEVINEEKIENVTKEAPAWLGSKVKREKVEVQLVPIDVRKLLGGSTPQKEKRKAKIMSAIKRGHVRSRTLNLAVP